MTIFRKRTLDETPNWAKRFYKNVGTWLVDSWNKLHEPVPRWMYDAVDKAGKVLMRLFWLVGPEFLGKLDVKIGELEKTDLSSTEKFQDAFDFAKAEFPGLPKADLRLLVESLLAMVRERL